MKLLLGLFLVLVADIGASAESNKVDVERTLKKTQVVNLEKIKFNHEKIMEALENRTDTKAKSGVESLAER